MKTGRRWLALDADLMDNPLTQRIVDQFGAAGVTVWVAFLCACKRSSTPGQIRYSSDDYLRRELGVQAIALVNQKGEPWDLEDLWTLTGHAKQTKRTSHGGWTYVTSTSWEEWQKDARRFANTQRMAGKRRAQNAHTSNTNGAHNATENENDIPPTPQRGGAQPAYASPPSGAYTERQRAEPNWDELKRVGAQALEAARATMRGQP